MIKRLFSDEKFEANLKLRQGQHYLVLAVKLSIAQNLLMQ